MCIRDRGTSFVVEEEPQLCSALKGFMVSAICGAVVGVGLPGCVVGVGWPGCGVGVLLWSANEPYISKLPLVGSNTIKALGAVKCAPPPDPANANPPDSITRPNRAPSPQPFNV